MTIDLRSDTVTMPTDSMLDAMHRARLGDDGREGDPTVVRLEELAASRTGKEAGLFLVSGTLGFGSFFAYFAQQRDQASAPHTAD